MAAISQHPQLVQKLFLTTAINKAGQYSIEIIKDGVSTFQIIDSQLPCKAGVPVFSGAESELWVALLEKAWSKARCGKALGSYFDAQDAAAVEVFRALTGAPSYSETTSDENRCKELLEDFHRAKQPMTAKTLTDFF